jgi:hypothetical protein
MIVHSHEPTSAAHIAGDDSVSTPSIWALALGVFSLLTLGLTSIPAIVCGHWALSTAPGTRAASLDRRAALAGLSIGYLGVVLLATTVTTVVRMNS